MILVCTSAWINIHQVKYAGIQKSFSWYCGIMALAVYSIYSIGLYAYLISKHETLFEDNMQARFGSAISNFAFNRVGRMALVINLC